MIRLAGLPWGQLAWIGAAAILVLLAAFLVRPARRRIVLPSLVVLRFGDAGRAARRGLATWPHRLLALVLGLAAVGAGVLSAGDPDASRAWAGDGARTVVVVDGSASMAAGGRFTAAVEAAIGITHAVGDGESLLVGLAGERLIPLTPWTHDRDATRGALQAARPGGGTIDAAAVVADAAALLGERGGRIVLVSDMGFATPAAPPGIRLEGIPVGSAAGNAWLTGFAARLEPGRRDVARVLVVAGATGTGELPLKGTLSLATSADGKDWTPSTAKPFEVRAGTPQRILFEEVPLSGPWLKARIRPDCDAAACDALAEDDEAVLELPGARPLKVDVVGPADFFLDAALSVLPGVAWRRLPDVPATAGDADLLVIEDTEAKVPSGATALLLRPAAGNGRVDVGGELEGPEFDATQSGDLLAEALRLDDVNVGTARVLRPDPADRVVFASRNGRPLVLRRDDPRERTVAIAFTPAESDLGLRYAWPVLLSNVLSWAAGASTEFVAATDPVPEAERDLAVRAALPAFEGASDSAWQRLVARIGGRLGRLLALLALVAMLIEWAVAQRRPDLGV